MQYLMDDSVKKLHHVKKKRETEFFKTLELGYP